MSSQTSEFSLEILSRIFVFTKDHKENKNNSQCYKYEMTN